MACRIGITTNPGKRKREWQVDHPNLYNWEILERYDTKKAAQQAEDRLAAEHGCVSHAGGDDAPGQWMVYKFNY